MAFTAIFMAVALLRYASAQNITTSMILPDGLFYPYATLQTFVGEMTVTRSATYYTLNCGNYSEFNFWPGTLGCINNNSYTFSADAANTRFLLPNYNLGQNPQFNTGNVPTWLENFNQTVTINCAPPGIERIATCTTTSLYNSEDADDQSIISSTIATQNDDFIETSYYSIILTVPGAAPAAAATPTNPTATPANPTASPAQPPSSSPPKSTPTPTSTSTSTSTNATDHNALSTGTKAGIGVGVPIGVFAVAGIALLFYSHSRHKERPRQSQTENLMPYDGVSPSEFERKDQNVVADTSGLYEMEGRQSPVRSPELEG